MSFRGYALALAPLAALSALRLAGFEGPSVGVALAALWVSIVPSWKLRIVPSLAVAVLPAMAALLLGPNPWEADLLVASAGALVAHLVFFTVPQPRSGPSALLISGFSMWLLALFHFPAPPLTTLGALTLALGLGWAARRSDLIDDTGMVSGALVGLLIIVFVDNALPGAGLRWFAFLLAFFVLGSAFTKFRHGVKASLGLAQKRRDFRNVIGNCFGPLVMAVAFDLWGPPFDAAFLASITTVTADTIATEVGLTQREHPRLITTLQRVPPGTSGAVSLLGETAALGASVAMGLLALLLGIATPASLWAPVVGGFLGTHVDSLLGATVEKRWRVSNHAVNFLASLAGAAAAIVLARA